MKLANYVRKQSLFAMLLTTVILLILQALFAFIGQIDDLSDQFKWTDAAWYVFWDSPQLFIEMLPVAALVGAVTGLGALSQQTELTVMRAAGVSSFKVVSWTLQVAFLWALAAVLVNQYVLPATSLKAEQIKNPEVSRSINQLSGVWLNENNRMSYISKADTSGVILGFQSWLFSEDGDLVQVVSADTAVFEPSLELWQLSQPKVTELGTNAPLTTRAGATDSLELELSIRPDNLYLLTRDPEALSLTDLSKYVSIAESKGENAFEHRLNFWQKLLSPLAVMSLVLLASAFVFGESRSQSMGFRLVLALLVGLGFSYFQKLFGFISLATQSAPWFYVLLPIGISSALGWYFLRWRH